MADSQYIISQIESSKEFIEENWSDDISAGYLTWISNSISSLKEIENEMISIRNSLSDIKRVCNESTEDDDKPKVLTLGKTR